MSRLSILLIFSAACAATPKTPSDPARELALAVHRAAGGDRWNEVSEVEFHFVVYEEGVKKGDVHHRWNVRENSDHVVWTDRQGAAHDEQVNIRQKTQEKGYARWVNDTYWLILPLKLLDPGVKLALEPERQYNGKNYQILRISFEQVGLTPGDVYWLFVDPTTHRIERWEMVLEGDQPPAEGYSFKDYQTVGPLTLAMDHESDDGKRRVALEQTTVR